MCAYFFLLDFLGCSGCLALLPVFPNVKRKGSNFARQVLSVMIHHPVPGGPQTGREEKAAITVINGEGGLPVTAE